MESMAEFFHVTLLETFVALRILQWKTRLGSHYIPKLLAHIVRNEVYMYTLTKIDALDVGEGWKVFQLLYNFGVMCEKNSSTGVP